jgi:hypothetical protein
MPRLEEYKGKVLHIELVTRSLYQSVEDGLGKFKLIDVEPFGIWVESEKYVKLAVQELKQYPNPALSTPVFFLPFSSIVMLIAFADYAPIDESELLK